MTKLVDQGAADEAGSSRNQDVHGRRVYSCALALLAASLLVAGCDHGKRRTVPPPARHQSFLALDAEQQRLVRDYQPVSRALTSYERHRHAAALRTAVRIALARLRRDPATGETARAKQRLVAALEARRRALVASPGSERYRQEWDRSVVEARRGLSLLQDIRDRARLIPLPEDSVS